MIKFSIAVIAFRPLVRSRSQGTAVSPCQDSSSVSFFLVFRNGFHVIAVFELRSNCFSFGLILPKYSSSIILRMSFPPPFETPQYPKHGEKAIQQTQ
jgi:hypothetical protein